MGRFFRGRFLGGRTRWRAAVAAAACALLSALTQVGLAAPANAVGAWAGQSFCGRFSGAYLNSYNGVAACVGPLSGTISYNGVTFDTAGWNCVELAARYLYAITNEADVPPEVQLAKNVASRYHTAFTQFPLYPASGGTGSYSSSIQDGDIISMWGGPNAQSAGHVALVTDVSGVSGGNGRIKLLEENGSSTGIAYINVSGGQMTYGSPTYAGGEFYYTSFQWLSPAATLPAKPTSPHVTSTTGTSAALAWSEPASDQTSFASQYRVVGTSAWTAGPSAGASATSMIVTGLKTGTKYTFQVGARNSKGTRWSAYFPGATVALPAEPGNVTAHTKATSAVLTWADNSNETSFVSQYKITGSGSWTAGPSVGANTKTMTVTGLTPGQRYIFQVGARNVAGTHWSAYAIGNTPQALPAQPGNPRVTAATGTTESLTWADDSDNETGFVSQYRVGSGSWVAGPSVGANVTSMTVGGLKNGTRYTFQVGARNSVGTHWSVYFYGWTQALPAEPTGGSASMGSTTAALTWADNSDNETSFVTQYQPAGSSSWIAGPSVGANVTSVTVTGLNPSTHYTFQVGARNSVGTHWSPYFYGVTSAQAAYNTGRQVSIVSQATGGVSGHTGPGNSYSTGPTHPANSPLWIVCYVNGQSIAGPYGTESIWDVGDDGYYYSDAWLYTGTNGPAVPACAMRNVTVVSQATGGDSGHAGPANSYAAGPSRAANSPLTIVCYVNGQSIAGPYGTEAIWDLATDGRYYADAWLYTGTNGPAVPAC